MWDPFYVPPFQTRQTTQHTQTKVNRRLAIDGNLDTLVFITLRKLAQTMKATDDLALSTRERHIEEERQRYIEEERLSIEETINLGVLQLQPHQITSKQINSNSQQPQLHSIQLSNPQLQQLSREAENPHLQLQQQCSEAENQRQPDISEASSNI